MSDTVIQVENLGKKYIIGHQQEGHSRYVALRDVLADGVKSLGHRLRHPRKPRSNPYREEFWALKDVSFEVKQGEVVGIIGRNGAGKSTLLKILSRITEPTTGRVRLRGRVASLLEVGTGFHPELTGRENIFLNGAILGMSRTEINRKFDEIVEFAEVSRFLDTPVKRYSSGMYVRLAFAVAAHLEPEILVVDEVLAVGDAAFQKKCLGRMEAVSKEGRTVLFVSHNMAAIKGMCTSAIAMNKGSAQAKPNIDIAIQDYLADNELSESYQIWDLTNAPQSPEIYFREVFITNYKGEKASSIDFRQPFSISIKYFIQRPLKNLRIGFFMKNIEGVPICGSNDPMAWPSIERNVGEYISRCDFPAYLLNEGRYSMYFGADIPPYTRPLAITSYCVSFTVEDVEGHGPMHEKLPGVLRPKLVWNVLRLNDN